MNTFFLKKSQNKWTRISPGGSTKSEIDFIISNNKEIMEDVNVINRFSTGSDHRLVRGKITLNLKRQRVRRVGNGRNKGRGQGIIEDRDAYQEEIRRQFQGWDTLHMDIEEINDMITEAINRSTRKVIAKQNQKEEN